MNISESYKKRLKQLANIPVLESVRATHMSPLYDQEHQKIDISEFEDGFHGNRIFKTPNTTVMPIWFSYGTWNYGATDEFRIITVELDINNIFNPLIKTQRDNLELYAVKTYGEFYVGLSDNISEGDWISIEEDYSHSIPALIKEVGYDSYISFEDNAKNHMSYAVFDREKIKILDFNS